MNGVVSFYVVGVPRQKGSMRAIVRGKRAIVVEGSDNAVKRRLEAWRELVAAAARDRMDALELDPYAEVVSVTIELELPRPKAHYLKRGLRATAPRWHGAKPDVDKLARAILDSLSGITFVDDALVAELVIRKRYTNDPTLELETPGAYVRVEPLTR